MEPLGAREREAGREGQQAEAGGTFFPAERGGATQRSMVSVPLPLRSLSIEQVEQVMRPPVLTPRRVSFEQTALPQQAACALNALGKA